MGKIIKKLWVPRYPKWAEQPDLQTKGGELHLSYRWIHSTRGRLPMLMAALMALLMITGLYWIVRGFIAGVFPLPFMIMMVLIGILLTTAFPLLYTALGMLLNRTTIRLDKNELARTRGPVPWGGHITRSTEAIAAVEVREVGIFCDLILITKKGKEKQLMRTIHEFKHAIEKFARQAAQYVDG